jgi:hypothetical protein
VHGQHTSVRRRAGLLLRGALFCQRCADLTASWRSPLAREQAGDARPPDETAYPTGGQSTDQEPPTDRVIISDEWIRLRLANVGRLSAEWKTAADEKRAGTENGISLKRRRRQPASTQATLTVSASPIPVAPNRWRQLRVECRLDFQRRQNSVSPLQQPIKNRADEAHKPTE